MVNVVILGVESMCQIMEKLIDQEKREVARENVRRMIKIGKMTLEEIAQCTGLSIEEVRCIAEEESVPV